MTDISWPAGGTKWQHGGFTEQVTCHRESRRKYQLLLRVHLSDHSQQLALFCRSSPNDPLLQGSRSTVLCTGKWESFAVKLQSGGSVYWFHIIPLPQWRLRINVINATESETSMRRKLAHACNFMKLVKHFIQLNASPGDEWMRGSTARLKLEKLNSFIFSQAYLLEGTPADRMEGTSSLVLAWRGRKFLSIWSVLSWKQSSSHPTQTHEISVERPACPL